jgi:hypothetical protein
MDMPTTPALKYAPDNPELLKTVGRFADLIQETVNFGTHILEWGLGSASGGDETAPIALSVRHILELLDSVSINIRNSSVDPCKLLLRGALESLFGVVYILEADTTRRSMAFMATYANQRLKTYRKFDLTSEQGKEYRSLLKKDRLAGDMIISIPPTLVKTAVANLESLLKKPEYKEANAEYHKQKKAGSGNPYWYSLYDGPKNIEKLADHLKLSAMYHILYRQWSSASHGTDIIQGKISARSEGQAAVLQFRLPTDAQVLTSIAVTLGLELFQTVIKHYVPDRMDDYRAWYTKEIRAVYLRITQGKIIQIEV